GHRPASRRLLMRILSPLTLLLLPALAQAQDIQLQWQARLFDGDGAGLDGDVPVELRIIDSDGLTTWSEELSLPARDGYVSHLLGGTTPLPLGSLPDPAFLDIRVGGQPMGDPRRL